MARRVIRETVDPRKAAAGKATAKMLRAALKIANLEPLRGHGVHWNKGGCAVGGEVTAAGKGWYVSLSVEAPGCYTSSSYARTNEPGEVYGGRMCHHNIAVCGGGGDAETLAAELVRIANAGWAGWWAGCDYYDFDVEGPRSYALMVTKPNGARVATGELRHTRAAAQAAVREKNLYAQRDRQPLY